MTYQDLLDFYAKHPPIEVGDPTKYLEVLNHVGIITLLEFGKCKPVLDETTFTTPTSSFETVLYSLAKIHPNIIDILFLAPKNEISSTATAILPPPIANKLRLNPNADLFDLVVANELEAILKEYTSVQVSKLIYKGQYIKLKPDTEYYVLFHRAPNADEIPAKDLLALRKLLDVNLNLAVFGSDIFTGEMGIRSVSLSGLSVSFNVPQPESKIKALQRQKDEVLSQLCLDYSEGMIGLIY